MEKDMQKLFLIYLY